MGLVSRSRQGGFFIARTCIIWRMNELTACISRDILNSNPGVVGGKYTAKISMGAETGRRPKEGMYLVRLFVLRCLGRLSRGSSQNLRAGLDSFENLRLPKQLPPELAQERGAGSVDPVPHLGSRTPVIGQGCPRSATPISRPEAMRPMRSGPRLFH